MPNDADLSPHPLRSPIALLAVAHHDERHARASCLRQSGCEVEPVGDGRIALARALTAVPDIVLAAERLPGLNGAQLAQLLRADVATANLPILLFDAEQHRVDQLHLAGADAVLVKPVHPQVLLAETRRLLTESAALREKSRHAVRRAHEQLLRSPDLTRKSFGQQRRLAMSRALTRAQTTTPPMLPPALACPVCDKPLRFQYSHIGGVNEHRREQWDYFQCSTGCGTFQFRQRTNKVRRIADQA